MSNPKLIGILGGTFDPIHNGHLHVANCLRKLPFSNIRLLPCYKPVHRTAPIASPEHRLAMIIEACKYSNFIVEDDHEIKRKGRSYMIDTIIDLKQENPNDTLFLILGQDSFQTYNQWHRWEEILDFCNLLIVNRPHAVNKYPKDFEKYIDEHRINDAPKQNAPPSGKIYFYEIPPLDISATTLRQQLHRQIFDENTLPHAVIDYIRQNNLYR